MLSWKIDCLINCFPSTFLPPPRIQNLFCQYNSLLKLAVCQTFPVLPSAFGDNNRFLHFHRFQGSASRYSHSSVHRRDGDECSLKSYTRACFTCLSFCWTSSVKLSIFDCSICLENIFFQKLIAPKNSVNLDSTEKWRLRFWYAEIVNLEEVETRLRNPSLDHNSTGGKLTMRLSF